jgi:hypothetical protein
VQYHAASDGLVLANRSLRLGGMGGSAIRVAEVVDVLDRIREMTGIYGLGFRKESILGLAVPIAFVVLVGGAIAALILFRL